MARTDWTFTASHNDGTTTTLRVCTSDTTAPSDWPGNGATFDARGRLATYPVWYAAYDDEGGSFMTTRATVRVVRDYWGKAIAYVATDDFGADTVRGTTRREVRELLGNAAIRSVMDGIYKAKARARYATIRPLMEAEV